VVARSRNGLQRLCLPLVTSPILDILRADPDLGTHVEFPPGTVIVQTGDRADHTFVIVSGSARVQTSDGVRLAVLGSGELVGELSILAGGTRSADVIAIETVTARRIDRAAFIGMVESQPELERDVANEIVRRLDEHHVAAFVTRVLGADVDLPFEDLRDHLSWQWIPAGHDLFRVGDPAESGYLVISGRLRVVGPDEDGTEITLGEIGADEFVDKSGIFTVGERSVTVQAIRDSLVAEVTREAAVALLGKHPAAMGTLLLDLGRRVRHGIATTARRTVALTVTADVDTRVFGARLHREMAKAESCAHVWEGWVDTHLSQPGAAQAGRGEPAEARLLQLLHEIELSNRHLLLETGRSWTSWSERAARQADRLVACISPDPSPDEARVVDLLFSSGPQHAERVIVFIHPPGTDRPRGSAQWVERWNADRICHVVSGSAADMARLGRMLTGTSVGLVLGGGGARGFAHVGARRAMVELGIPIDMVGGSSIGGALGGGFAMGKSHEDTVDSVERLFKGLLDYTIPVVSLVKGEAITKAITDMYEGWTFEDLWRPFFCISTNLTRSIETIHRRGELVTPIRASVSIPGVMPPVAWGDDLLVDGGVLNNLPADVMRPDVEEGTIIACDVAPPRGPRAKGEMALSVSGWEALRSRATKGKASFPGVTAMLMRTMIAGSVREQSRMLANGSVDLHLYLDLRGVSLLDFDRVRPVVDQGYEVAMPLLEAWLASRDRGW
jgi:predicted acylesterase/phospholipase RssA/CRP-like cAMP-binding protein